MATTTTTTTTTLQLIVQPLLTYALETSPSPLQVSPETGPPYYGNLQFVISCPASSGLVTVSEIMFILPIGDPDHPDATDLTDSATGITPSVTSSGEDLWAIEPGGFGGQFVLKPQTDQPGIVSAQGLTVTMNGIQVSSIVGTAVITIDEMASYSNLPFQRSSFTVSVPKFPYGFNVNNFTASAPTIQNDTTVTLSWIGSVGATYTLLWGEQSADVTNLNSWNSPPLTDTTTFILQVTAQEAGQTVNFYDSVTVIVADPDIIATTLTVLQTSMLEGDVTVSGNLTIGEATQSQYLLDVANGWTRIGAYNTQTIPPTNLDGGVAVGWNQSGGAGETNLYNLYPGGPTAFQFSQATTNQGSSTATDLVTFMTNGHVGIGTNSPTNRLTVVDEMSMGVDIQTKGGTDAWAQINLITNNHTWTITTSNGYEQNNIYFINSITGNSFNIDQNGQTYRTINKVNYPSGEKFLLNTLIGNNSTSLQDTTSFTSAFTYYEIIFDNLAPTVGAARLCAQFQTSSGWATDSTYCSQNWGRDVGGDNGESSIDSYFHIWTRIRSGPNSQSGLFGNMTIFNPSATGSNKTYVAQLYAPKACDSLGCIIQGGGSYNGSTDAVTGIQFYFGNGNIYSGAIKIYGWN